MRVIGTAGHVDHGKSALVAALTGTHPDRLKEEKEREMTIDLGFAWFDLPGGEPVGVVDVPGHRDFIENMLAGVGGIDAVLFVVAADEGAMPQTREHLAIIDLLQIPAGIIVLNKIDLISELAWLDLVENDLRQLTTGTILENVPILRVSSRTGEGIEDLKHALAGCLTAQPVRSDLGKPRLSIDRVFSVTGFGTVATGTLLDGNLKLADEVEVLPGGFRGRIRGLQTHKKKEQFAVPGSRVAVNLSGVELNQIKRGDVLARPGQYQTTQRMDVHFRLLSQSSTLLRHSDEVKFFIGAMETSARVRLLGLEEMLPGMEGWLQLELEHSAVAVRGDRYILRRPSPAETLGGGQVLNPHPPKRHKRFDKQVLEKLEILKKGAPGGLLLQSWNTAGPALPSEILPKTHLSSTDFASTLQCLLEEGELIVLDSSRLQELNTAWLATREWVEKITHAAVQEVQHYHSANPLRRGMPREALKSRLKLVQGVFQSFLRLCIDRELLAEKEGLVNTPEFKVIFTIEQTARVWQLLSQFAAAPFMPPSVKDSQAALGENLYQALIDQNQLVQVSAEVVFDPDTFETMQQWVLTYFRTASSLTIAEFRDQFATSRKYALAFLEHLDTIGITQRQGEGRIRK